MNQVKLRRAATDRAFQLALDKIEQSWDDSVNHDPVVSFRFDLTVWLSSGEIRCVPEGRFGPAPVVVEGKTSWERLGEEHEADT